MDKQLIPAGYKQTELGVIPESWEVKKCSEVFIITAGGDLRKSQFSQIMTQENPYPIFSNAITEKGLYGYSETFDYDGEFISITARGGIGHAVDRYGKFCTIGRLLVLSGKKKLNPKFFSELINQYVEFASESTSVPQLTAPQLAMYSVLCPSYEEQTAIANTLLDVDALISSLEKLIDKKTAIKTATMQQLLTGKKRLPPFDQLDASYKQTELGEIPVDWEVEELGKIFEFKNGLNKSKEYFGSGTPIVNYMDVYRLAGICEKHVNGKVVVSPLEQKNYSAKRGDVFFTRTSETTDEIGLASVLLENIENAVFSGFVLRARQKIERFVEEYMKYSFRSVEVRKQIQSTVSAT